MSNKQYAIALYEATKDLTGKELSGVIVEFVAMLNRQHKIKSADKIINEFVKYSKKQAGIIDLEIISSRELGKAVIEEIKKIFGQQTESVQKVDKNLLGGIKIKTDSVIFDASLKSQLIRLKNSFI